MGAGPASGDEPDARQRLRRGGRNGCGQSQAAGESCDQEDEEEATPRRAGHGMPVPVPAVGVAAGAAAGLCASDSQSVNRVTARSAVVA